MRGEEREREGEKKKIKEIKGTLIRKEEVKLSLFSDDGII